MDIDPMETIEKTQEANESASTKAERRLNNAVAITIALLATFMGICKVKDDNICQAMQQVQADKLDYWSWYQAHNIRREVLHVGAETARAAADAIHAEGTVNSGSLAAAADRYDASAQKQEADMKDIKGKAEASAAAYDQLNYRDDQFDLMDSALALAIALLAITSLTRVRWLYWMSLVPTFFGVLMGLSGLFGWSIHPDFLARWLGA